MSQTIDGLRSKIDEKGISKALPIHLIQLGELYLNKNADSAQFFANQALNHANLTPDEELRAVLVKAKVCIRKDSLQQARYLVVRLDNKIDLAKDNYYVLNYRMIRAYISELNADLEDAVKQNQLGLALAKNEKHQAYLARFNNNLGLAYKAIGQQAESLNKLKNAALYFDSIQQPTFTGYSYLNMGAVYIELEKYDSASYYLEKSKEIFEAGNLQYELANYYGNKAKLFYYLGKTDSSIYFLHQKLVCIDSAKIGATQPLILLELQAFDDLGKAHFKLNHFDDALLYYRKEYKLAQSQNLVEYLTSSAKGISLCYESKKQLDSSLFYLKSFVDWNDSLITRKSLIEANQQKSNAELKQILAHENTSHQLQLEEASQLRLLYIIVILILLALLISAYAVVQSSRKKQSLKQLDEESLKTKKLKLENELLIKNIKLGEQEKRIENTVKEIKEAISIPNSDNSLLLEKIAKKIEGKNTQNAIASLDHFLIETDQRLFEALSQMHPTLTRSELRICTFVKLNLTTKEIASITHQTTNSIKVARYRLRKKLGLSSNQNLVGYLNKIVG